MNRDKLEASDDKRSAFIQQTVHYVPKKTVFCFYRMKTSGRVCPVEAWVNEVGGKGSRQGAGRANG